MQDLTDDFGNFGDLDAWVDTLPSSAPALTIDSPLDFPDIPSGDISSVIKPKTDPIAQREDKPVAYVPRTKTATKSTNKNPLTASPAVNRKSQVSISETTPILRSKERTGSINKISTPPLTAPISFVKTSPLEQDQDLIEMAATYDVFSLSKIADYQVVSPTAAEFVAQYYRLINIMIAKVTLNQLVTKPIEIKNMWIDRFTSRTPNISGNTIFSYDEIYRYCVQDSVIDSLRAKYKSKQIHFTQMQTYEIMGAGNGISSAKQAAYYLEKMATACFSSTISMLVFRKNMIRVRDWFENAVNLNSATRLAIQTLIQDSVMKSSVAQATKYQDDDDVFVVKEHRCILFAKKLLSRHTSQQLSDNQLQLSALVFLMSGVSEEKPQLGNIGFKGLYEGLVASPPLVDSLVHLSYESHRHCYPINELSHL